MTTATTFSHLYQLVFDIRHCIFKVGDETQLVFSIYDNTQKEFITEQYFLHLTEHNFPKVGSPEDCKVLFKDLTKNILLNDIYIICYIYRIGQMAAPDVLHPNKYKYRRHGRRHRGLTNLMRPFGVSVLKLKDSLSTLMGNCGVQQIIDPHEAPINVPSEELDFINLPYYIIQNINENKYTIAMLSIGIGHSYILYKGDIDIVKQQYEYFNKLTFIETLRVYTNQNRMNDKNILHLTVNETHVSQRRKASSCNVETKICLKNNKTMQIEPKSIKYGISPMSLPLNEHKTCILYHTNDPIYNQRFIVLLPDDFKDIGDYHLYFSCWHTAASNRKPSERGFGWFKLSDIHKHYDKNKIKLYPYNAAIKDKYLECDINELKSEGKSIQITVNFKGAQLRNYFGFIVFGYSKDAAKLIKRDIPNDISLLILQFLCLL